MKFTLYWNHGVKETIEGDTIAEAFNRAGYSLGALGSLDFFEIGCTDGKWTFIDGKWTRNS